MTKDIAEGHKALLVGTYMLSHEKQDCQESVNELERLADTYGIVTLDKVYCHLRKIESKTYLGSGKLEELIALNETLNADVIVFNEEIAPHQQRELEKSFKKPVIDRAELILGVFAKHAQTKEAKLQIELAKARYQLPRLKRLWTHLSRQSVGGKGYLKGEGEKQIEIDRRLLKREIDVLQKRIEEVARKREVQRAQRNRSGIPSIAIIGYTNAGKSTLLHTLTQANVLIEDKLFATLDTTTRKFILPSKQEVLFIDTVGFIDKLPHLLIAAFKSTLEEALNTDLLLHLIDISHPHAEKQAETTLRVLKELKAGHQSLITVLNKIDLCSQMSLVQKFRIKYPKTVAISAKTGEGIEALFSLIEQELKSLRKRFLLRFPQSEYHLLSELLKEGKVHSCNYEENDILLDIEIPARLEYKIKEYAC